MGGVEEALYYRAWPTPPSQTITGYFSTNNRYLLLQLGFSHVQAWANEAVVMAVLEKEVNLSLGSSSARKMLAMCGGLCDS